MNQPVYSFNYSQAYQPPMPVVDITISGRNQSEQKMIALVDSGSDGTMIPLNILKTIGARFVGQARVRGVLGDSQLINLYMVTIHIEKYQIRAVQVIGSPDNHEVILGRDVLNQLIITLNGLANVMEVQG